MNIVKGVADLLRRTSSNFGESTSGSDSKFPPVPKVCFSDVGEESIVRILWDKHENAFEKVEKNKLFYIFIKQFLVAFKNWTPVGPCYSSEDSSTTSPSHEHPLRVDDDFIVGCSFGHPAEVIRALIEEISDLTLRITNSGYTPSHTVAGVIDTTFSTLTSEALLVLDSLAIINRSIHNRRLFEYYNGIQRLTALMKGAVVQLKAIATILIGDDRVSNNVSVVANGIQKVLVHSVVVLCSFINANLILFENSHMGSVLVEFSVGRLGPFVESNSCENISLDDRLRWHQKAVISILEAGGLNWLVELLRVVRRIKSKEFRRDLSLQYQILTVLLYSLSENPRGQNHFKSIGGLEALLDGFSLSSYDVVNLNDVPYNDAAQDDRDDDVWVQLFQLHILYIMVLREATFANLNNLQYLCENGRIQKFANSFCSLAFLLQEYRQLLKILPHHSLQGFDLKDENDALSEKHDKFPVDSSHIQFWIEYSVKLIKMVCSFVAPDNNTSHHVQVNTGRVALPVSLAYSELSIRWFLRVIFSVFPCIKATSNEDELPISIRIFIGTLQLFVLSTLKNVIISSPASLDILREEGIWDLLFSENFFYFRPGSQQFTGELLTLDEGSTAEAQLDRLPEWREDNVQKCQFEVISFVELAATSDGVHHYVPELSALLDTMEQCVCDPAISKCLAKSFKFIIQCSNDKAFESIKTINGITRLLKVICLQVDKYNYFRSAASSYADNFMHLQTFWLDCIESSMEVFGEINLVPSSAKSLVLRDSVAIDCLFNLFWDDTVRNRVLAYILELMKILPSSVDNHKAKMYLYSKYFESFTQIRERGKEVVDLSADLLTGIREVLFVDPMYHQAVFREGDCFLHIVSLLNGNLDEHDGERLVLNVLQTLTKLLDSNDESKAFFRSLVGNGYQTLQSLLLDFCQRNPCEAVLTSLLDMLVDGKFISYGNNIIKNEDVVILYFAVLQKSGEGSRLQGLNVFIQLLKDSISNRTVCVRAGMLNFLLDWFSVECKGCVILEIAQLIQVVGGHSISGKDIRKIFAILRGGKVGARQHCSLLLTAVSSMLKEKGPTSFFDLNGNDTGIMINTPFHWPSTKGFSFTCWLRIENFPSYGAMGLFNFFTGNGKGCFAVLEKDRIIFESLNMKQQTVQLPVNFVSKQWYFVCLSHGIGRTLSGGSILRCYVDGVLVSSEKCRYAKVSDMIVNSTIGMRLQMPKNGEAELLTSVDVSGFYGQIGPVYLFSDAISSEQVNGIYALGPSYMYSFLDSEVILFPDFLFEPSSMLFDARDGLSSKIVFGLNAQASNGRKLFNVSHYPNIDIDKRQFEATVMMDSQLCSRRLLQQTLHCVGGISVFFPLIAQSDSCMIGGCDSNDDILLPPESTERFMGDVIELLASVLDENFANQQQMYQISGFSIVGFLLQSVPPRQLNLETLSALKHLFNISCTSKVLGDAPLMDALSSIFLDPRIWIYTDYSVQRELYMFLIQVFDNDPRLLKSVCQLPFLLDVIRQAYWDEIPSPSSLGIKPVLYSFTKDVIRERPVKDDLHKIRLLILSLSEMSIRKNIAAADVKTLVAFFETCNDMRCIEDVLHMVLRVVAQQASLVSFVEQVNLLGGCHVFVNLLQREHESIRLLSLQFLAKLLICMPTEKKGSRFFNFSVSRVKSLSDNQKKFSARMQLFFSAAADRLFRFPLTDNLCATLFDVLLGGASPKQVIQKQGKSDRQRSKNDSSSFVLPQILVFIFKYLSCCDDESTRIRVLSDLLDLLQSNSSNIEALMEYGWNAWLKTMEKLDVLRDYNSIYLDVKYESSERAIVRSLYVVVFGHYICYVKGGWQQLDETINFLLLNVKTAGSSCHCFVRDILDDLTSNLIFNSTEENIFSLQPSLDNVLYLLRLIDELLISEIGHDIPFPSTGNEMSIFAYEMEAFRDFYSSMNEFSQGGSNPEERRNSWRCMHQLSQMESLGIDKWWSLYDNVFTIICTINGKGLNKKVSKPSSSFGPSFGQKARGIVESFNVPATEVAAVVSGSIGNTLSGKSYRNVDRYMILKGDKFPRILFRLTILYICKASLERASRCVQQVASLLPSIFVGDDEQCKSRLHFLIRILLFVRTQCGCVEDDARFHVICHLIRETISCGKSLLATSIAGVDELTNLKDTGYVDSLIQKDRVLMAVSDEYKYINGLLSDRCRQLDDLQSKIFESLSVEAIDKEIFEEDIRSNLDEILAFDDARKSAFQLSYEEKQQNVSEKWIHMFRTLIDERGPWSVSPFPTHWKLDKTEDSCRRRLKLRQNYHFDEHLCHPVSVGEHEPKLPHELKSDFAGQISDPMKHMALKVIRRITDETNPEFGESDGNPSSQKDTLSTESLESLNLEKKGTPLNATRSVRDSSSMTERETSEVLLSIPCVLVTPKRKIAGNLAILKSVLYFFGEFLVEGTGGSSVFRNLVDSKVYDTSKGYRKFNSVKWRTPNPQSTNMTDTKDNYTPTSFKHVKRHRRWNIGQIKAVHWTRFLLRSTAIEIFFSDSVSPLFLNFASPNDAKEVGMLIISTRNDFLFPKGSIKEKNCIISFIDRRIALQMMENATESWRKREITNFEYLMILNTLSGRSYNDLTQYPVFPWVLADYSSEILDFNKSSTFRDLTKPVGALDAKRLEVFEDRFRTFTDPDIPGFYYGSHYSSMGIVLYYLLRLEPYTSLHRNLQGGKFDNADRLFHSVEGTYRNCLSNTSDVKELIPEFFYLPEFLVNSNAYHLGIKQDGEPVNDVCLPPWAKGSPELFVHKNREALESEYVSSNLHHWIDLVFGYKQRGKPALEAANIFYYLTYEDSVDLESIEDELQRSAIEDQIANFGQTPIQLFRKKHPRRGPPIPIAHPLHFAPASICLTSVVPSSTNIPSGLLFVDVLDSVIVLVNHGPMLCVKMWITTQLQSGGNFTFSSHQDPLFGVGSDILSSRKVGSPSIASNDLGANCFSSLQTPTENFLISCGNWENSFQVISLNDGRTVQNIRQHKDVVSCVAVTENGSVLATGSYDTTVMLWDIVRHKTSERRPRNTLSETLQKDCIVAESPFHILCGHDDVVACLHASVDLDIVVSGSKDGTCIFHSLRKGTYLRTLRHPSGCAVSKLAVSKHGRVAFYAEDDLSVNLHSINGKHLASCESNGRLNCMQVSKCGEFLVCGGDQGQVVVRSLETLDVVRRYDGVGKAITCLAVTPEECFVVGTKDGSLLVYSIENPLLRRSRTSKFKASAA